MIQALLIPAALFLSVLWLVIMSMVKLLDGTDLTWAQIILMPSAITGALIVAIYGPFLMLVWLFSWMK